MPSAGSERAELLALGALRPPRPSLRSTSISERRGDTGCGPLTHEAGAASPGGRDARQQPAFKRTPPLPALPAAAAAEALPPPGSSAPPGPAPPPGLALRSVSPSRPASLLGPLLAAGL